MRNTARSYVVLKAPENWKEKLKEISKSIRGIEKQYPRFRYPFRMEKKIWIPSVEYKKDDADKALKIAKTTLKIIPRFVEEVYNLKLNKEKNDARNKKRKIQKNS